MMRKFIDRLIDHLFNSICSEKGYGALFKAAVILIASALLAISQNGPLLYDKDIEAYKAKFKLETSLQKQLKDIDCSKTGEMQFDCMLAKHQMKNLDAVLGLLERISLLCLQLGFACGLFALMGFLGSPFCSPTANKSTADSTHENDT